MEIKNKILKINEVIYFLALCLYNCIYIFFYLIKFS